MDTGEIAPESADAKRGNLREVEQELHQFEDKQSNVTRTLQMVVYPAMVAFIILAAYGFYLVQSLTTDVHNLTQTIAEMNTTVHGNMTQISGTMDTMNHRMGSLVNATDQMTNNIMGMNSSTQTMAGNIQQMNASTQNMAASAYNMQRDMWSMNKNISGPMKMFNKFSPFGSDKTTPYVVPPPVVSTPYYNYNQYNQAYNWPGYQAGYPATGLQQETLPVAASPAAPVMTPVPADTSAPVATPTPVAGQGNPVNATDEHSVNQADPTDREALLASSI